MNRYRVTRDGVTVATFPDEAGAWAYLLNAQSQSVDWACRYEGWNIIYPDGASLAASYGGGKP